ncbi:MAG: hypothetical protein K0R54_1862 [Clostridiaceae bacterium]|jgi:hypothetical protein|nr:hypothetical protein [Clostridiaceae bacterium]
MSENMSLVLLTFGGIVAIISITYFFIKVMIDTTKYSMNKN